MKQVYGLRDHLGSSRHPGEGMLRIRIISFNRMRMGFATDMLLFG
jgi:hypothetical protein